MSDEDKETPGAEDKAPETATTETTPLDVNIANAAEDQHAGAVARIAELEAELSQANATLLKVQAHNYTLMNATPATTTESTAVNSQSAADPDDGNIQVDDLFDDEDKD